MLKLRLWFIRTFCKNTLLLQKIATELQNIHFHLDHLESFYMTVNNIREVKENTDEKDKDLKKPTK